MIVLSACDGFLPHPPTSCTAAKKGQGTSCYTPCHNYRIHEEAGLRSAPACRVLHHDNPRV